MKLMNCIEHDPVMLLQWGGCPVIQLPEMREKQLQADLNWKRHENYMYLKK